MPKQLQLLSSAITFFSPVTERNAVACPQGAEGWKPDVGRGCYEGSM